MTADLIKRVRHAYARPPLRWIVELFDWVAYGRYNWVAWLLAALAVGVAFAVEGSPK